MKKEKKPGGEINVDKIRYGDMHRQGCVSVTREKSDFVSNLISIIQSLLVIRKV